MNTQPLEASEKKGDFSSFDWKQAVEKFTKPSSWRAGWQVINTFGPYALLWAAMIWSLQVSWLLIPPLAVLAALQSIRIFIIFHDCCHGSFFKSRVANDITGHIAGLLTFTPFDQWKREHITHHATSGKLDRRGIGDIWTMTVREYLEASRWRRFSYRLTRNPFVLFVLAPVFMFIVYQRIPARIATPEERHSTWFTNVMLLGIAIVMSKVMGFWPYAIIQLSVMAMAGTLGIWLFYVQHQFEDAYWESGDEWDYAAAALKGSSFYKLPRILQWFSGNIGFHHIHHLSPRIPNYALERCHWSHPKFQEVKHLTLFASLKLSRLELWDEQRRELLSFKHFKQIYLAANNENSNFHQAV